VRLAIQKGRSKPVRISWKRSETLKRASWDGVQFGSGAGKRLAGLGRQVGIESP